MEKHIVILENGEYFFIMARSNPDGKIIMQDGYLGITRVPLVQPLKEFEKNNPDFFNK